MSRGWAVAGVALVGVGVASRVNNAFRYAIGGGFDARENWHYVDILARTWTLPAPHESWSASHPPLFHAVAAGVARIAGGDIPTSFIATRLLVALAGLVSIGLAVALVRRAAPDDPRRALLAAGLLLFLPVQIYMSAMFGEEMFATLFVSIVATGLAWQALPTATGTPRPAGALGDVGLGVAAGLALLSKLTGLLAIAVAGASVTLRAWARGQLSRGLSRAVVIGLVALVVGGWFYARNLVRYGYLYPHGLAIHAIMDSMPPGDRRVADYLRIPLATWTEPDLVSPPLLRSVWGSTYVSVWSDGHKSFLPKAGWVGPLSRTLLVLGLVPTLAWLLGLLRGAGRAWREPAGPDAPLLLLTAALFAGYVAFTWRDPVFAVLKGSYLLGLSVPFAYHGSEVLAEWTDPARGRLRAWGVTAALVALAVTVTAGFSLGLVFETGPPPGLAWQPLEPVASSLGPVLR